MLPIENFPSLNKLSLSLENIEPSEVKQFICENNASLVINSKSAVIEQRFKAFLNLVNDWINDSLFIGTAIDKAIRCIIKAYQTFTASKTSNQDTHNSSKITLKESIDYFESLLGNTFKLI